VVIDSLLISCLLLQAAGTRFVLQGDMTMSSSNPDPAEDHITGLEPGGGVPPGETPPAEAQTNLTQGHAEGGPKRWVPWLWLGIIGLSALVMALLFLVYAGVLAFS
jgi:hypothetical protein